MTKVQLKRWQKLAFGFSQQLSITERRKLKLLSDIENFFECRVNDCYQQIRDWDANKGEVYVGDEVKDFFDEHHHFHFITDAEKGNRYLHQLEACIRSGFDMAVAPSCGVLGYFTKQDCIDVFKGRVPKWFTKEFETPWDKIPNEADLWL